MSTQIYDHKTIEEKWMKSWEEQQLFQDEVHKNPQQSGSSGSARSARDDSADLKTVSAESKPTKEKMYLLFAFAYPSGAGLHVGHVESKTALDILARYHRMNGKQVFFPVGWDAFGLPAENYAVKTGVHPAITTKNAIDTFRGQIKRIGISYDWANELATNHPEYYKWTQWIFLQLHKKGLAYRGDGMVNWCPSCQTVLANEQVVNGHCERCGSEVIQKQMEQWFFKITEYKDELISGLDEVDWPHATKLQQLNWIGKSKGLAIDFMMQGSETKLTVWTKFWETVFGTTFVVIAPEQFRDMNLMDQVAESHRHTVQTYIDQSFKKTEEERKIGEKEKTGVDTGLKVINPVNGSAVPLYIADYVLMNVGTGVVMGVPAHDDRDFEFATKFKLPIIQVVSYEDKTIDRKVAEAEMSFEGPGKLMNSGNFDGLDAWHDGKQKMAEWMIKQGFANWQTTYKLRDWLISRQRYWGAPIPIVYDPSGAAHPVKEEHLPWLLPTDVEFKPTGESPLTYSKEFKERVEKLYGKGWRPEYDTMDTFVDSSWYFMRYLDARDKNEFATREQLEKWLPTDLYMIGPEHIVLHLLYARFFTKFLRDEGYLSINEPFKKMRHQGMIMGPDGKKMSKSKGNVINPDEVIEKYGADTLRVYEMFMGPIEADKPWSTSSVVGIYRFLMRIHQLVTTNIEALQSGVATSPAPELMRKLHLTMKKINDDIPALKFNTAIAAMMELLNVWEQAGKHQNTVAPTLDVDSLTSFIQVLSPFAPFLAEELYQQVKSGQQSVHLSQWPSFDEKMLVADQLVVVIQVNGKLRAEVTIPLSDKDEKQKVIELAKSQDKVKPWLQDKTIVKEIYIPGKLVNLAVS
ncbi:MAG: leucine--tRNA ligase [Patescibacteria group bacterium]